MKIMTLVPALVLAALAIWGAANSPSAKAETTVQLCIEGSACDL